MRIVLHDVDEVRHEVIRGEAKNGRRAEHAALAFVGGTVELVPQRGGRSPFDVTFELLAELLSHGCASPRVPLTRPSATLSPRAGRGMLGRRAPRVAFCPPRGEKVPKADEGWRPTIRSPHQACKKRM